MEFNFKDGINYFLWLATFRRYERVLGLFLERYDVKPDNYSLGTQILLSVAVSKGREAVVRLFLIRSDVDLNLTDYLDHISLYEATSKEHEAVMRVILKRSDIKSNIYIPSNASLRRLKGHLLLKIVWGGHVSVIRSLFKCENIDPNLKDFFNYPLYFTRR